MHRGQNTKMMKIKEEVMDPEPHPSENGAYQIYFLKVEETEEDTPPGDVIKTESSVDNAGSLILQSGCEGTSFYRHMSQDDGGNEKRFIKREPDVGTPSLQNSLNSTSPSLQMIGGDEERNEVRATCIKREPDDVTTEENLMVVSNTKLWTTAESAARVCVTDQFTSNCGSNPGGDSQQSHGAGKHCQDRLGSSRFHQGKTNKQKETLARGCKGEKQHCCPTCNKSFTRKDNLTRHTRTHFRVGTSSLQNNLQGTRPSLQMIGEDRASKEVRAANREPDDIATEDNLIVVSNTKLWTTDESAARVCGTDHFTTSGKSNPRRNSQQSQGAGNQCQERQGSSKCQEGKRNKQKETVAFGCRGEKKHCCPYCNKSISRSDNLTRHLKAHFKGKPNQPPHCNKEFSKKKAVDHNRTYLQEKLHQCSHCKQKFSQEYHLREHLQTHSKEKLHQHPDCDRRFAEESQLLKHQQSLSKEKPHHCAQCNKCFHSKYYLYEHQQSHNGEKYTCSECSMTFSQKKNPSQHARIHKRVKPCNMKCSHHYGLTQRKRSHLGEKPYICILSQKIFSRNIGLHDHLNFDHSDEKRKYKHHTYVCAVCNTSFSTRGSLKVHLRIHTGEKPFCCSICRKRFSQSSNLRTHMRIHSGEKPYECEKCNMAFSRSHALSLHMKTHTDGDAPIHYIPRRKSKKRNISEQITSHFAVDSASFKSMCQGPRSVFESGGAKHVNRHNNCPVTV